MRRAWADALLKVNRSEGRRKKKDSPHVGHYAFPDPIILVSPESPEKRYRFIAAWTRARTLFTINLHSGASAAVSNNSWRDFLEMISTGATHRPGTKTEKRRQPVWDAFGLLIPMLQNNKHLSLWRGQELPMPPPENIIREIVWELFELNFRSELFALDSRASTIPCTNEDRVDLVNQCFVPTTGLYFIQIPEGNHGLVDDNWRSRRHYLLAMFRLMVAWEGRKPQIFGRLSGGDAADLGKEQMKEFEESIAQFYTQTFFDYFGRAALIPHCIAEPSL